jgi:asparagine N-glycosylation enzyme membrane subunit Stt3
MSSSTDWLIDTALQNEIFGYAVIWFSIIFFFASIILFIVDGIKAKKENRKRRLWIRVIFYISMAHVAIAAAILIFCFVIAILFFLTYCFFPR